MPSDTRGSIIVKQDEPAPQREPPTPGFLAVIAALVLAAVLGVGAIGDQPATGDIDTDEPEMSVASTPVTAPTTTTAPAPTLEPVVDLSGAVLITDGDLATNLLTVELIQLPPGLGPVSHLVESRGVAHAFAPLEERRGRRLGLRVASWHEGWGSVVEAIPATEAVVAVGGHDLGLVALTQPAEIADVPFGYPLLANLSVWASTDGISWSTRPLDPPLGLGDLVPVTFAVGRDRAWVFGYEAPMAGDAVLDVLAGDIADVVRSGDAVVSTSPDGVSVHHSALPTAFAEFSYEELGLDPPVSDRGSWARIETADLATWQPAPTPPVFAVSVDRDGTLLGMDQESTVWRLDRSEPEIVMKPGLGGTIAFATRSELGVYAVMTDPAGTVRRIEPGGEQTDHRFAGCCYGIGPQPVSSPLGALFNASLWGGRPVREVTVTTLEGGGEVVVNSGLGRYEVRDAAGDLIAEAALFGHDDRVVLEAPASSIDILTATGEVAAAVALDDLDVLYEFLAVAVERPGVLYTDGQDWQRIDLAAGPTAMLPIDDGFLVAVDDDDTPLVYLRVWDGADR
jgi:hypothetical protein